MIDKICSAAGNAEERLDKALRDYQRDTLDRAEALATGWGVPPEIADMMKDRAKAEDAPGRIGDEIWRQAQIGRWDLNETVGELCNNPAQAKLICQNIDLRIRPDIPAVGIKVKEPLLKKQIEAVDGQAFLDKPWGTCRTKWFQYLGLDARRNLIKFRLRSRCKIGGVVSKLVYDGAAWIYMGVQYTLKNGKIRATPHVLDVKKATSSGVLGALEISFDAFQTLCLRVVGQFTSTGLNSRLTAVENIVAELAEMQARQLQAKRLPKGIDGLLREKFGAYADLQGSEHASLSDIEFHGDGIVHWISLDRERISETINQLAEFIPDFYQDPQKYPLVHDHLAEVYEAGFGRKPSMNDIRGMFAAVRNGATTRDLRAHIERRKLEGAILKQKAAVAEASNDYQELAAKIEKQRRERKGQCKAEANRSMNELRAHWAEREREIDERIDGERESRRRQRKNDLELKTSLDNAGLAFAGLAWGRPRYVELSLGKMTCAASADLTSVCSSSEDDGWMSRLNIRIDTGDWVTVEIPFELGNYDATGTGSQTNFAWGTGLGIHSPRSWWVVPMVTGGVSVQHDFGPHAPSAFVGYGTASLTKRFGHHYIAGVMYRRTWPITSAWLGCSSEDIGCQNGDSPRFRGGSFFGMTLGLQFYVH